MKKLYLALTTFGLVLFTTLTANAQSGFSEIIKVSPGDATKLIDAYGQPLFKGIGVGMNSGWANTAKVKKVLRFDLRVTATAAFTPASDKSFDVTKIGLSSAVTPATSQTITPTIGGERSNDGVPLNINNSNGKAVATFNMPKGYLPVTPTPQVQLTVGLPERTDLTVRYIPTVSGGNNVGSVDMIGFGLKHDLTKYLFGPAKTLVPFDLSVLFAYSRMNLRANLNVQPDNGTVHDPNDQNTNTNFSGQHTDGHFNSFLGEAIISKKILFFTPFLAVGYNTANTTLAAVGNYPATTSSQTTVGTGGVKTTTYYSVYTNPVNLHETGINGARVDVGFQLDLAFFRIYASGSLAQYKSVNAGIGFGF
ncbi:MAG: hypothetical protein JWQ84_655 [Mucilaginibacter sp.]|nr:hypothetical protein [Mucilaginibacter sp.]